MPIIKLGTELNAVQQREALAHFVHRYTREHMPEWARKPRKDSKLYPVQFVSDADWLAHTYFSVTKDGKLSRRERYCQSHPTWPDNPELREADLTYTTSDAGA